jgi:hypothetical protein
MRAVGCTRLSSRAEKAAGLTPRPAGATVLFLIWGSRATDGGCGASVVEMEF